MSFSKLAHWLHYIMCLVPTITVPSTYVSWTWPPVWESVFYAIRNFLPRRALSRPLILAWVNTQMIFSIPTKRN